MIEFREATNADLEQIMEVRLLVKENVLSNPSLVTINDCEEYINNRGKGWVGLVDNKVVGFSIVDLKTNNVWALFVHPDFEKRGIGRKLHNLMIDWYFTQVKETIWLGTEPGTRAEQFYRKSGWKHNGFYGNEYKFEMSNSNWELIKKSNK